MSCHTGFLPSESSISKYYKKKNSDYCYVQSSNIYVVWVMCGKEILKLFMTFMIFITDTVAESSK